MFRIQLLLITLFIATISFAQNSNLPLSEEGKITYQEVVEENGNPEIFFNRAISWINSYYKNPVNVTKTRDPQSGLIKGLHRFRIDRVDDEGNKVNAGTVQYEFVLEFKDGRYRYTLTEFVLKQASKVPAEKWMEEDNELSRNYLQQVDEFSQTWIKSLREGMKPEVEETDDDW